LIDVPDATATQPGTDGWYARRKRRRKQQEDLHDPGVPAGMDHGLIFLFVGKDDPDVKWNAANSLLFFGGLTIISFVLGLIPIVGLLSILIGIAGFVYWILFLVKALQGNGERIPTPGLSGFMNQYVDQIANAVK
jgi:uncharacterized membrane protein